MKNIFVLTLLIVTTAFAESPQTRFSIIRPLGYGGGLGKEVLSMTCAEKSSPCQVQKIVRGQVTENLTLPHDKGLQIAERLSKELQRPPSSKSNNPSVSPSMLWSLDYNKKQLHGSFSASDAKDPSIFAIMRAEAELIAGAK